MVSDSFTSETIPRNKIASWFYDLTTWPISLCFFLAYYDYFYHLLQIWLWVCAWYSSPLYNHVINILTSFLPLMDITQSNFNTANMWIYKCLLNKSDQYTSHLWIKSKWYFGNKENQGVKTRRDLAFMGRQKCIYWRSLWLILLSTWLGHKTQIFGQTPM